MGNEIYRPLKHDLPKIPQLLLVYPNNSDIYYWIDVVCLQPHILHKWIMYIHKFPELYEYIKDYLERYPCDVDISSNTITPLLMSCVDYYNKDYNTKLYVYEKLVKLFIDHGANVNHVVGNGLTPLMYTCRFSNNYSNIKIVKLLLDAGADTNIKNHFGNDALLLSIKYGSCDSNLETIKLLLDNGANINSRNIYGNTPLITSCIYIDVSCSIEIVKYLITRNKNIINVLNDNGWSALMVLCKYYNDKSHSVMKLLLNHGININMINKDGKTALMLLCRHYKTKLIYKSVKLLLDNGAKLNIIANDGSDVLSICKYNKTNEIYNLLLEYVDKHENRHVPEYPFLTDYFYRNPLFNYN